MLPPQHQALPVMRNLGQKVCHILAERVHEHGIILQDKDGADVVLNSSLQQHHVRTHTTVTASAGLPELRNTYLIAFNGAEYLRTAKWPLRFINLLPKPCQTIFPALQIDNPDLVKAMLYILRVSALVLLHNRAAIYRSRRSQDCINFYHFNI